MPTPSSEHLPVSFASFVVSLAQSALMHLGEVAEPGTGRKHRDLELARNTIDLIGLLQEKTQGNLDSDEQKLVESVLYDLRTKFVEHAKA